MAKEIACEEMADWIFEDSPRHHGLDAEVAASRLHWWGTPRYRDRMAIGDRVWLQVTGHHDPGIYYVATIVSSDVRASRAALRSRSLPMADRHPV